MLVVCHWKIGPHPRIHCLRDMGSICPFPLPVLYHGLFQKQSKVSSGTTAYTFRKVVKCVKPQGFPLKSRQNIVFVFAIFFDGQMKEKLHEPHTLTMHPLFHDQQLSRIQATVHKPASAAIQLYNDLRLTVHLRLLNLKKKKKKNSFK